MVDSVSVDQHKAKIVMVIDNLEPGGAQRQFCLLATSLRRTGFAVRVIVFRRDPFFEDGLRSPWGIPIIRLSARNRVRLYSLLRTTLREQRPDVVLSFLSWPNFLVELAGLPKRSFAIIVSERNLDTSGPGMRRSLRYFFHRFTDAIVCNSYAQRERMMHIASHLTSRTSVIVNGLDTNYFRPPITGDEPHSDRLRVLVLARFAPQKNVLRFVEALHNVRVHNHGLRFRVDWYGKRPTETDSPDEAWGRKSRLRAVAYYRRVERAIADRELEDCIRLHDPCDDVLGLYSEADVVCVPSLYEGCSNVICEAMACGVPVLASAVSDNVRLVTEGRNGFLFDPLSVEEIADTIVRFARLPIWKRRRQGQEARAIAEATLSHDTFLVQYLELIRTIGRRRCYLGAGDNVE